jgi:hypothetical protein
MNTTMRMMICGAALLLPGFAKAAPLPDGSMNSSSGMIALNSLPDPSDTLATAKVADAKGTMVGSVQKVVMDASGKPQTVDVSLMGTGAVVAVDASKFNYNQGLNILTAELDAQQIAQQPAAPRG